VMMGMSIEVGSRPMERVPAATRVLSVDALGPDGLSALEALGCSLWSRTRLGTNDPETAVALLDPNVLVVRSSRVDRRVLEAGRSLSLVVRAGAGVDNIDVAAASARGIFVANCPGKNAMAVAELAWGLILACDRKIPDQTFDLREGLWKKAHYADSRGLYGRTLGVVGLGSVGREVAERGKAFGMRVLAWSRRLTPARAAELELGYSDNLIDLARVSDVVSLHVAATAETEGLIGRSFFDALKPGATFVNTSRGSVVDQPSLLAAIRSKGLRVGLDVYGQQPKAGDDKFADPALREPLVYGTHHTGASTEQAQEAVATETARVIEHYVRTGEVLNCVNRAKPSESHALLTVRHLNKPGVLASVFAVLGKVGVNVEEMENVICAGGAAACARIRLSQAISASELDAVASHKDVLAVTLAPAESRDK